MHSIRHRVYALLVSMPLLCSAIKPQSAQHRPDPASVPSGIKAILEQPRYKNAIWAYASSILWHDN